MSIMLVLKVKPVYAYSVLKAVRSVEFQRGLANHFVINPSGTVGPRALNWLYCWATTGWSRAIVAADVQHVWNRIFDIPVAAFNPSVLRPIAEKNRY
jgi:hypothetical protein